MTADEVLAKVRKLLRLSECEGATEAEAALAADRAQALLTSYKLSLGDVGDLHAAAQAATPDPVTEVVTERGQMASWFGWVLAAVADTGFCRCLLSRPRRMGGGSIPGRYWLIGRPLDVEVARELLEHLCAEVERLTRRYEPAENGWRVKGSDLRRARSSFALGCASRICSRLREAWAARQAASGETRALVVSEGAAVAAYMAAKYPKLGKGRAVKFRAASNHYAAGREAGNTVSLSASRKLTGGASTLRLGVGR
ncbi:MAG TPA: DUF2786 domain-containing protein [Polyangia bacterium]|nr:DUF2786 domain-containing protein [Polyangia bacterium]